MHCAQCHSSSRNGPAPLPREVPHEPGPDNNPFATITRDAFADWLKRKPLLFTPGTSILYSNFGFDLLAIALSEAATKPYPELLKEKIIGPLGMKDTGFVLTDEQRTRLMQGHAPDGTAMPDVPTGSVIVGSGGLYSTPNDLLRWMKWHLDRSGEQDAEVRVGHHPHAKRGGVHRHQQVRLRRGVHHGHVRQRAARDDRSALAALDARET